MALELLNLQRGLCPFNLQQFPRAFGFSSFNIITPLSGYMIML